MNISDEHIGCILRFCGIFGSPIKIEDVQSGLLNTIKKCQVDGVCGYLIVRVRHFEHTEYGQEFVAERFVYPMLEGKALTLASLIGMDLHGKCIGKPAAVFSFVPGRLLDHCMSDSVYTLPKNKVLEKFGQAISLVHSVPSFGFGPHKQISHLAEHDLEYWEEIFRKEHNRLIVLETGFAHSFEIRLKQWIKQIGDFPKKLRSPCLVHGDLHAKNVIVQDNGDPVLIDWEASRNRIAPFDFAQIRYCNFRTDETGWDRIIDTYLELMGWREWKQDFLRAIKLFECFWRLRMGLFQRQFPFGESEYFGNSKDHLKWVQESLEVDTDLAPAVNSH